MYELTTDNYTASAEDVMQTSRRRWLGSGIASLLALASWHRGAAVVRAADSQTESSTSPEGNTRMSCLDYGLSFLCLPAAFNSVRFWVESRTTLIDDKAGTSLDFY